MELDLKAKIAALHRQIDEMSAEIDKTTAAVQRAKGDVKSIEAAALKKEEEAKAMALAV